MAESEEELKSLLMRMKEEIERACLKLIIKKKLRSRRKQYPVLDVTGDRIKVLCYKEKYCIGTWNVRSMNQGKLKVIKHEMARVDTDILGISELKWTRMGNLTQMTILSTTVGKNPSEIME